jgi:hypothetical protein
MLNTIAIWLSVVGWLWWGWTHMRDVPPGWKRLAYYLITLLLLHEAASHGL